MKFHINHFKAAVLLAAGAALLPMPSVAGVRVCTFPGSPSTSLDLAVAGEALKAAGMEATVVRHGIGGGDGDDGVSARAVGKALGHDCDVIAGFPRAALGDSTDGKLLFSRGYLHSGYVSVEAGTDNVSKATENVVAATYASPAQLIAVQQKNIRLDLENTAALTVDAVAAGRAQRAIVWYPAVVAYRTAHPEQHFHVAAINSQYADWHLVFAFGAKSAALQKRVDGALASMANNGRLAALTNHWTLPGQAQAAATSYLYLDGPVPSRHRSGATVLAAANAASGGSYIKVSDATASAAPGFRRDQVSRGKGVYSANCAKCHGAQLQGVVGPALRGPAFAPVSNSHLTIGGIFGYIEDNMPADRPGKLKAQEYADVMAFLLYSNGYGTSEVKMTADSVRASKTPLNAGSSQCARREVTHVEC